MNIDPFKLERYFSNYEFTAEYSICNSDSEAMTVGDLLSLEDGAADRMNDLWLGYTDTKGHSDLRKDITDIYSKIGVDDLLVCTGAQEPIFLFAQACLSSGHEVIVQTPCYQSLQSIPASIGCMVKEWKVRYEGDLPTFDLSELKSLISDRTKAIIINSPQNPTGFHFTREEQTALVEIARAHGVIIFCDEVYRELEHSPEHRIPAFADVYEHGVSLGVMSKSYGLPGLRIGWLASQNHALLEKVAMLKEYTTICNSAPSEFLAGVALRHRQHLLDRNLKIVKENLALFDQFFAQYADLFSWHRPHAGPIGFVKMKFDDDDRLFAQRALEEAQLLILPGWIYDYKGYFRVGFGRRKLPRSLAVFQDFVERTIVNR